MIGKLRFKLILVTMISVAIMLAIIFVLMNMFNFYHTTNTADDMLHFIAENNGTIPDVKENQSESSHGTNKMPAQFNEESPYQTRYFIVQLNKNNSIIDINTSHVAAVSDDTASSYAWEVLESGSKNGYQNFYRYLVSDTDFGKIVIFLDCSIQLQSASAMILTSCFIAFFCLSAIFIVIFIFSKRVIRPMIDNMEKQKRFITDAGHELKTPLAIINANVEVIEIMKGKSEFLTSIKNQVERMDGLIKSMLQLAKMEENSLQPVYGEFDLSTVFSETVEPFMIMAHQRNRLLRASAPQGIKFNGDQNAIKNLISILIDNAIKYSNDGGTIEAVLKRDGKNIVIEVQNTADVIDEESLANLFDRFYRPDSSRSRETGGFGIGLSMAQSIVQSHKGQISAEKTGKNSVTFRVVFRSAQSLPLLGININK